jgi:hypothetical protein
MREDGPRLGVFARVYMDGSEVSKCTTVLLYRLAIMLSKSTQVYIHKN